MFTKILIGSDGSEDALHAAHLAAHIARPEHSQLIVVNAFNLGATIAFLAPDAIACSEIVIESGEEAQQDVLTRTREYLVKEGMDCQTRAEIGHPVEETLRVAEQEKADLIVVGSHGLSGFQKLLLGGVADGIAQHAPCPVLIVRGHTNEIHQILVAIDGSNLSYAALKSAVDIARPLHVAITVLNVMDTRKPFPGLDPADTDAECYALRVRKIMTERVDALLKETGIKYRICQEKGHPVEVITNFAAANNNDLIVLGSHGMGTFQRLFLGSVSYAVLHHAPCPVLIVR